MTGHPLPVNPFLCTACACALHLRFDEVRPMCDWTCDGKVYVDSGDV